MIKKGAKMRGISNRIYSMGIFLLVIGGVGIVDANNDISFWISVILFGTGFGCCLAGYLK